MDNSTFQVVQRFKPANYDPRDSNESGQEDAESSSERSGPLSERSLVLSEVIRESETIHAYKVAEVEWGRRGAFLQCQEL